ncbi:BadF/BadG/BcrA/BcrD ATPase family protein [Pseudoalteromonas mariniglutinosa]|uniref:BadF/BadG/BcrA/BcrD ATPase family protein n=1 Tax=Pseudoalteromonas mariniglutinosa TaxID=206042 RepID=UPI00384D0307
MAVEYLLAIDGGGTKTVARLINNNTGEEYHACAGPASVSNDINLAIENIASLVNELCRQSRACHSQMLAVMGLAGGSSTQLAEQVSQTLTLQFEIKFASLYIVSDAVTSLYGANLGESCAVVALGTGAVGARLNENAEVKLISGWGFAVDDFGGGARLGLHAVQHLLDDIDYYDGAKSQLTKKLSEHIGECRTDIAQWLKKAKPDDYARFSPLIFSLQKRCHVAQQVLAEHGKHVELLIRKSRTSAALPVILIGGLAKVTCELLAPSIVNELSPCKGDSLTGAAILAAKYYNDSIEKGQNNEP